MAPQPQEQQKPTAQPQQTPTEPDQVDPGDGRGPRPTDPNELAMWIVEQTTGQDEPLTTP